MATSTLGLPIAPFVLARGTSILFGALGTFMGAQAMLSPKTYAIGFGLPVMSSAAESANSNAWVAIAGARTITGGLSILTCAYLNLNRAVGVLMAVGGITGLLDGYFIMNFTEPIDESKIGEERKAEEERVTTAKQTAYGHWGFLTIYVGTGIWMIMNC